MQDVQDDPRQEERVRRARRSLIGFVVVVGFFLAVAALTAWWPMREWYEYSQINDYGQPTQATIVHKGDARPLSNLFPICYEYQVVMSDDTIWIREKAINVSEEQYDTLEVESKITIYFSTNDYRVTSLSAPDPTYHHAPSIFVLWCLPAALTLAGLMVGISVAHQDEVVGQ